MKKLVISIVSVAVFAVGAISAQAAGTDKIAVVDFQTILEKAPQVNKIRDELKNEFSKQEQNLVNAQKELQANADKLQKNNAVMSQKDKKALEDKVTKEQQELQQNQMAFQQAFMKAQNDKLKNFIDMVKGKVGDVAKKDGYTIVLTNASVVYSGSENDITNDVLKELK